MPIFYSIKLITLFFLLLLAASWTVGGWLIVTHAFHLRSSERLVAGLAVGMIIYLFLTNALAHFFTAPLIFWLGALLVLIIGIGLAWYSKRPWLDIRDLRHWPILVTVFVLTFIFFKILNGLPIWDDYVNLPLVSIMAAGDIPPHYYINASVSFGYHYGQHLLAAGPIRQGGFYIWAAWSLVRALVVSLIIVLGGLWARRVTSSSVAGVAAAILLAFGAGARWLLLFLPMETLRQLSHNVTLLGSGAASAPNLLTALISPWSFQGSGPLPFPFAFGSGVITPVVMAWSGSGAFPLMILMTLLLLVCRRPFSIPGLILFTLIFSTLALAAEHVFALLAGGIGIVWLITLIQNWKSPTRSTRSLLLQMSVILFLGGIIALVQGGVLTEIGRGVLPGGSSVGSYGFLGFSLRPDLPVVSMQLGVLSLLNPSQLVVAIAELGPGIFLAPVVMVLIIYWFKRRYWMLASLGIGALAGFLIPLFLRYGAETDIARIAGFSTIIFLLLSFPYLWKVFKGNNKLLRYILSTAYVITIFGSVILFGIELLAILTPTPSNFLNRQDIRMMRHYWNTLEPHAQVFDHVPYRAVTIFGRATTSNLTTFILMPEWKEWLAKSDPAQLAEAGFDFVYMDHSWWSRLTDDQRDGFETACVETVEKIDFPDPEFRWLLDISKCKP